MPARLQRRTRRVIYLQANLALILGKNHGVGDQSQEENKTEEEEGFQTCADEHCFPCSRGWNCYLNIPRREVMFSLSTFYSVFIKRVRKETCADGRSVDGNELFGRGPTSCGKDSSTGHRDFSSILKRIGWGNPFLTQHVKGSRITLCVRLSIAPAQVQI
jgi:hypothetical protein